MLTERAGAIRAVQPSASTQIVRDAQGFLHQTRKIILAWLSQGTQHSSEHNRAPNPSPAACQTPHPTWKCNCQLHPAWSPRASSPPGPPRALLLNIPFSCNNVGINRPLTHNWKVVYEVLPQKKTKNSAHMLWKYELLKILIEIHLKLINTSWK